MPAQNVISPEKLFRLIGTPSAPIIIDISSDDGARLPGAHKPGHANPGTWRALPPASAIVVACDDGRTHAPAIAAWFRQNGHEAEHLEGGVAAWRAAGLPSVAEAKLPGRDDRGRTLWVTRARPKVDRIACPWLIRRFVDPEAVFFFAAPGDVAATAERLGATPFDVDGTFWSHRGDLCTFDVMVDELALHPFGALARLAQIVRGADTGHPEIAPQAAGLLAISLGLSRMYADDHAQLDAGMLVYDALYRWCRDAVEETHDWVSHQPAKRTRP